MNEIYRSAAGASLLRERYAQTLKHWPVENEQQHVPTPHGDTFVVVSGPATAPALLLLHGSGSNSTSWMGEIAELATHFRVYSVDVIGEPGLSAEARPPLDSAAYAQWLDAVLDHFGLDRVSIMAMSLGGWLAIDYAIRRPQRVERLALRCPGGVGGQRKAKVLGSMLLNFLGPWGQRTSLNRMLGGAMAGMDSALAQAVFDNVRLVSKHFRYRSADLPIFGDEALRGLTMPIHVLVGAEDIMFDSAETKRRFEHNVPEATVRLLPGVGHYIPAHPEETEFLAGATTA